jgi:hypothetical protein
LNVFAGVAQGPKHEAIRRIDRIIEAARPGQTGIFPQSKSGCTLVLAKHASTCVYRVGFLAHD